MADEEYALGVDVGNAKIKLCLIGLRERAVTWTSRALPYDARRRYRRHADFATGIPAAIAEYVGGRRVATAVAVMTNGYAYPDFEEGARHTMAVLAAALPGVPTFALTIDGERVAADQIAAATLGVVPFTNGVGAAHLARRSDGLGAPASGLVIDTGGDTSQVVPVVEGAIEPAARHSAEGALEHRLRHGKFVWIGSQSTPLESLASEIEVGDRRLPVIPRGVTFDHVAALLDVLPPGQAAKLSLFGLHPGREQALRGLAEAVNLDLTRVGEDDLVALAHRFHELAVARLAAALGRARATLPAPARDRAAVFGLGARLATAALHRAGVASDAIVDGATLIGGELAVVASVYGAAHAAAEHALGAVLPARLGPGPA